LLQAWNIIKVYAAALGELLLMVCLLQNLVVQDIWKRMTLRKESHLLLVFPGKRIPFTTHKSCVLSSVSIAKRQSWSDLLMEAIEWLSVFYPRLACTCQDNMQHCFIRSSWSFALVSEMFHSQGYSCSSRRILTYLDFSKITS
jgi:hypothetical protein